MCVCVSAAKLRVVKRRRGVPDCASTAVYPKPSRSGHPAMATAHAHNGKSQELSLPRFPHRRIRDMSREKSLAVTGARSCDAGLRIMAQVRPSLGEAGGPGAFNSG